MKLKRVVILGLVMAASAWSASCKSEGGDDGPLLLFGTPEGIVEYSVDAGEQRLLIASPSKTDTLRDPSVSPDGRRIVYSHAPPISRAGGILDAHADLWISERDGSNPRMLAEHSGPSEVMYSPLWIDDAHLLAIARRLIDPSRPDAGAKWMLVGIDATTGARSDVLERVLAFDLSPDRTRVVYTAIESVAEQPLFIKTLTGGAPQRLLDSATTGLSGFHSPIFSPDGSSIYFGAHNIAPTVRSDQGARTLVALATHSAPDAIWRVPSSGGQQALLFQTELLEPYLAIKPDGVDLYALSDDLYRFSVEATTGEVIDTPKAFSRVDYVD